jgi:hypothetical protein
MPSATVSPIEDAATSSPGAGSSSGGLKGLVASEPASPSLATYSAPEELESGGSTKKSSEYFDQPVIDDAEEDLHEEFQHYFKDDDADNPPSENDGYAGQEPYSESEEDDDIQELNRDEDEDHDDDRGVEDLRVGNGHADPQQDPAQAPDPNDDMEANLDDDMEGAMEGNEKHSLNLCSLPKIFCSYRFAWSHLDSSSECECSSIYCVPMLTFLSCAGRSHDICFGYYNWSGDLGALRSRKIYRSAHSQFLSSCCLTCS